MVVEDNQTGITKYKIGLASFLIGSSYLNNIDIVNIAKSNLIDFANKMNATTFMAVLDENMVTYIYKYESENSIITTANVGTRKSLHCAALGKAMLAYKSEEEINKIIDKIDFIFMINTCCCYREYSCTTRTFADYFPNGLFSSQMTGRTSHDSQTAIASTTNNKFLLYSRRMIISSTRRRNES